MRPLDHVSQKVLQDIEVGTAPKNYTEAMRAWHEYNTKKVPSIPEDALIAFEIHKSWRQAEILEALLLSKCPEEEIQSAFSVPTQSIKIYAELFYDISVFRTDLDRLEYLEDYQNDFGRELKQKAVSLGYDFVLFTYANLIPKTPSQKKLIERMFMATAYKAMSMNYNSIRSEVNRQAVKHAELMIKAYELLTKVNEDDSSSNYDLVRLLAIDTKHLQSSVKKLASEDIV